MEKTIVIDGKEVRFRSTGALPLRFRMQFGKDFFKEFFKQVPEDKINKVQNGTLTGADIEDLNTELFYQIVWVMAKTGDSSIPDLLTWLDGFEGFPIFEVFEQTQDLLLKSIEQSRKK